MGEKDLQVSWTEKEVGKCLKKINSKQRIYISKEEYQKRGRYPIIDQSSNFIAGWTDCDHAVYFNPLPIIIFGDHTRILKYIDFPFAVGADGTKILKIDEDILDTQFFYFALNNLYIPNKGYNRHYKYLRDSFIYYPIDKNEQRTISHVLRTVQQAREARLRELELERERKAALMEHLFTHGTRGEATKMTEIGKMPESWNIVNLGDVCTFTTGKLNSEMAVDNGRYPFFTCSRETFKIDSYSFDQEAILLAGNNAQGIYSVKYYKGKFDAYQRTYIISVRSRKERMNYHYLLYDLSRKLDFLRKQSLGATTRFLTATIIKNLKMSLPSIGEQQIIADVLQCCDSRIAALEHEARLLEELFRAMLEELMSGRLPAGALVEDVA